MTLYVIVELGYEYNDEYYYPPECGGGNPIDAYRSRKKAEAECERLNRGIVESDSWYDPEHHITRDVDEDGEDVEVPITEWFRVVEVQVQKRNILNPED